MGLFTFIKNAGAKVFGIGKTTEEEAAEAKAKADAAELRAEEAAARNLEETINDLQLQVENLNVFIDDDMARVSGMAYDQATGDIWLGDVGQDQREEVNRIVSGGNYQWGFGEGSISGPKSKPNNPIGIEKNPSFEYTHSLGNSVIGDNFDKI